MKKLSACLVVKNEAALLERALQSIHTIADEIVLVDTGSTDTTLDIGKKWTDKVFRFPWKHDFSEAYNFALSKTSCEYVLRWDGDWVLQKRSEQIIEDLKKAHFNNVDIVHGTWWAEMQEDGLKPEIIQTNYFIFRKDLFTWKSPVHTYLDSIHPIQTTSLFEKDIVVEHHKHAKPYQNRLSQTHSIVKDQVENNKSFSHYLFPFYLDSLLAKKEFSKIISLIESAQTAKSDAIHFYAEKYILSCIGLGDTNRLRTVMNIQNLHQSSRGLVLEICLYTMRSPTLHALLLQADILAVIQPQAAIAKYARYMSTIKHHTYHRFSRDIEHPQKMLAHLSHIYPTTKRSL